MRRRRMMARAARWTAVVVSVSILVSTGYAWSQYRAIADGIRRSGTLSGLAPPRPVPADMNVLIMGLDSRLAEDGSPLPAAVYDAMHTGGPDVGGLNANVLILLHIPGDGSRATAMSVPRDDYVELPGRPDGTARGKIKQAYGLAYDQEHGRLLAAGVTDPTALEQRSRDAGRSAEIEAVSAFLGVPVDHFVEVTMVAFYQLAQVVAPITVCLKEDTRDSYSGADFHQGYQQLDAAQALAFVRQRRDAAHPGLDFTDLDRERRQQAFIASLAYQLRQAGTFADPVRLGALVEVARQNTAVDPGLDLLGLARQADALTSGDITFATLPIVRFGKDPLGEDVNIVDPAQVAATVQQLLHPAPVPVAAPPSSTPPPSDDAPVGALSGGGIPCVK